MKEKEETCRNIKEDVTDACLSIKELVRVFAAQRLELRATKSARLVLFDVMSFYGLWKDEIM